MSGTNGAAATVLWQSHDERIQTVEALCRETGAEVSALCVQVTNLDKNLSAQVKDGFDRVFKKLDPLKLEVEALSAEVKTLKAAEESRKAKKQWVKNTAIGLALTAIGAVAVKFGHRVWEWISA